MLIADFSRQPVRGQLKGRATDGRASCLWLQDGLSINSWFGCVLISFQCLMSLTSRSPLFSSLIAHNAHCLATLLTVTVLAYLSHIGPFYLISLRMATAPPNCDSATIPCTGSRFVTDQFSGPGKAIGGVCVCVCAWTVTFELSTFNLDIWHLTLYR